MMRSSDVISLSPQVQIVHRSELGLTKIVSSLQKKGGKTDGTRGHVLGKQLVDLLFCCVERKVANVERSCVLQLVLWFGAGASLVVIAVPSALLFDVSISMHLCNTVQAHLCCGI
jgi:hypothetical protein